MGFFSKLLVVSAIGVGVHKIRKSIAEDNKRRNTRCDFSDGISKTEFEVIVIRSAKGMKRIKELKIDGPIVKGKVSSISGLSSWQFEIDFNDYGHITGKYWLDSDNAQSNVPTFLASKIKNAIQNFHDCVDVSFEDEIDDLEDLKESDGQEQCGHRETCPYCGKNIIVKQARFCGYCGKSLKF